MIRVMMFAALMATIPLTQAAQFCQKAKVVVNSDGLSGEDTLVMFVWDRIPHRNQIFNFPHKTVIAANTNGLYAFDLDNLLGPVWFSLARDRDRINGQVANPILHLYWMEPGDDVRIDIQVLRGPVDPHNRYDDGTLLRMDTYKAGFRGPGSTKYALRRDVDQLVQLHGQGDPIAEIHALIDANSREMSVRTVDLLRAYGVAVCGKQIASGEIRPFPHIPDSIGAMVPHYVEYRVAQLLGDRSRISDTASGYTRIRNQPPSMLRDAMLVYYLLEYGTRSGSDELNAGLTLAAVDVTDTAYRELLKELGSQRRGERIMDITLPDENGVSIPLRSFQGKIVLLDFYYAACGPCAAYFRDVVKPVLGSYANEERVVFVSVSIDRQEVFRKYAASHFAGLRQVVNLYTDNMGVRHPIISHYKIVSYPSPILLDGQGRIIAKGNILRSRPGLESRIELGLGSL